MVLRWLLERDGAIRGATGAARRPPLAAGREGKADVSPCASAAAALEPLRETDLPQIPER